MCVCVCLLGRGGSGAKWMLLSNSLVHSQSLIFPCEPDLLTVHFKVFGNCYDFGLQVLFPFSYLGFFCFHTINFVMEN